MTDLKEVDEQHQSLYSSNELTNFENWYDNISKYTFETRFISLSIEEAKAIKFCYEYYSAFKKYEIETNGKQKGIGVKLYYDDENYENKFGEEFDWQMALNSNINNEKDGYEYKIHLKHLNNLSNKINIAMNEMKCSDGIFVKLSRRSPKDSANESTKMFDMIKNELNKKSKNNFKNITNSQIIESYFYSSIKSLCVYNGNQAIELFSRSYRIWKDIELSILKQNNFNVSVIVRKWNKEINPLWEFRLFLRNKKPTALTQYNPNIYLPNMYKLKIEIEKLILLKYEKIKNLLSDKLQYFTMDFAVIISDSKEKINENDLVIIEINPGPPVAGTSLFIWENTNDQLILSGDKPFETRINSSFDDIKNLNNLEPILPDSVICFVELLKGNKPKMFNKQEHTDIKSTDVFEQKTNIKDICVLL
eukprot:430512_1